MVLKDRYGRPLTHMRISVTLRCNHSCIFCHREGIEGAPSYELSPEEIGVIAKAASELGITHYKITGGEPLVRNDIAEVVSSIRPYASSVSLTTNGSLLSRYARALSDAGLDYINVSLHSLKDEVFREVTGGDLRAVINGINDALDAGLLVKLDFLLLSVNRDEVWDIINFASDKGLDINIIELIPLGISEDLWRELHVSINGISEELEDIAIKKYFKEFQSRPTYVLPTGIKVTLIKGYCNPALCMKCTRIRLTPDGKLKTCIYRNDVLIDVRSAASRGDVEGVKELIKLANKLREPFFK